MQYNFRTVVLSVFCSICGEDLAHVDPYICRNCGLLYCQFCKDKLIDPIPSTSESSEANSIMQVRKSNCKCDNGDVQSLEELRGYLIQDFLNYKYQIQVIANEPVEHFQTLLDIRDRMIALGRRFILLPEDFAFQKDPLSTFSMAEQFALEHLQDIRHNIADLYNKLLVNKEQLIEPAELTQVNMKLNLLNGKIEKFKQGFQSYFYTLLEDKNTHEKLLLRYFDFAEDLKERYQNLQDILDEDERIFFISEPISSNLAGAITRNIQVLISEKRMLFFRQPILKLKKKVKIIKDIGGFEITSVGEKNRKFRSDSFVLSLGKEEIELSGTKEQIALITKFVDFLRQNYRIPTPKEWKSYQIGRIWSADGYYSNIDEILRWELRTGVKNPDSSFPESVAGYSFGTNGSSMEKKTEILEFIDRQTEKITQRIRVLEYIIDDLKGRRNTMPVTEFFTLYEQFSMKLKDLEAERNSLLNHYSRSSPKGSAYC